MVRVQSISRLAVLGTLFTGSSVFAGTLTYSLNNTFAPLEPGAPSLVSVDPLGQNGFETANVFGSQRPVFKWNGNPTPINEQAGLTLNTTGFISSNNYTLELVFEFTQDTGTWRRIFDTTGRKLDTGFYVEPGDRLQVYNDVTGSTLYTTNEFHYIAMTVSNNQVKAYFDGNLELNSPTDKLNLLDPVVSFFVDNNLGGPAQAEFADGRVAFIRLTDGALSDAEIASRSGDPFKTSPPPPPTTVPLPAAVFLFLPGAAAAVAGMKRLRRKG